MGNAAGSAYVLFGKANGFEPVFDVTNLDGRNGFRIDGVTVEDRLGWSVSGAGDPNGDRFGGIIVSAPFLGPAGVRYVIYGY